MKIKLLVISMLFAISCLAVDQVGMVVKGTEEFEVKRNIVRSEIVNLWDNYPNAQLPAEWPTWNGTQKTNYCIQLIETNLYYNSNTGSNEYWIYYSCNPTLRCLGRSSNEVQSMIGIALTNINLPTNEIFVGIYNVESVTNGWGACDWWLYSHGLTNVNE